MGANITNRLLLVKTLFSETCRRALNALPFFFLNWELSAFEKSSHQACVINSAYNVSDVGLLLQDVFKQLSKTVVYKT